MAEIEYFVDPDKKEISKFPSVQDISCKIYSRDAQMSGEPAVMMKLKDAYSNVRGIQIFKYNIDSTSL